MALSGRVSPPPATSSGCAIGHRLSQPVGIVTTARLFSPAKVAVLVAWVRRGVVAGGGWSGTGMTLALPLSLAYIPLL